MITEDTFRGVSLQHLFLNGNRQIQLVPGSFQGLSTTGLYLHDCSLTSLSPDILTPLNATIRNLWLNGNDLHRIDKRLSLMFSSLQHLRLGANPLHCDCSTMWLKQLFDTSPDIFRGSTAPSCSGPPRLKGRLFNDSTVDEFRCTAPQFTRAEATFNGSLGRLVCAAAGDPAPTVYWIQPSGRATKHEAKQQQQQQALAVVTEHDGVVAGDGVDMSDSGENEGVLAVDVVESGIRMHGMYICIATNTAGNVTLTINLPPAGTPLNRLPVPSTALSDDRQPTSSGTSSPLLSTTSLSSSSPPGARADRRTALDRPTVAEPEPDEAVASVRPVWPPLPSGVSVVAVGGGSNADLRTRSRLFTLTEMVGAIVGTHVATLLVCLLAAWLCYVMRCSSRVVQRRARRIYERRAGSRSGVTTSGASYAGCGVGCASSGETLCIGAGNSRPTSLGCSKLSPISRSPCSSPPPEAVYLNGLGHLPYLDYVDLRVGRLQRR